jgi:hypothetical protein
MKEKLEQTITRRNAPAGPDVVASRTDDSIYVHVVNTERTRAVKAKRQNRRLSRPLVDA